MTTATLATSFSIKFSDLAITPVRFPSVSVVKDAEKAIQTTTIINSTKRYNRKHKKPNDLKQHGFLVSHADQQLFKKNCVKNGKGMSEVINAFMVAYNEGFKGDMIKRVMA